MSTEFKQKEVNQTYEFCRPHLKSFRTALDIGCDEFMFAGKLEQDFERIHCWDFRDKSKMMGRYVSDTNKVYFHHTGLGEITDTRYTKQGVGRVKANAPTGNSTLPVPIVTLDSFGLFDSVDFIKMDVEGYEPLIIKGAMETITRNWPVILCEINRGDFSAKQLLEGMGYSCVDIYHKGDIPHDYLFVKK
jgi:FkbM family methyltransferase